MPDDVKNVFISHVHEDDAGLEKLKNLLQKKGFSIRDASINSEKPNEAKSESYIKSQILAPKINWAGVFIVYISPLTLNSPWVNWEIEYAQKIGKRIVGVWAHGANDCDVPPALDLYADAVVGWNGDRIIDAISGNTREWRAPNDVPRPARIINHYSCA